MSTQPAPSATVYDLRPVDLTRFVERQSLEPAAQSGAVLDDLADAIEAIHACANLAGFSERPRSLIFALATCAHARGADYVELFDQELADLQNCSTKTVQRQRADYVREARSLKFDLIGIIEGEFDGDAHAATRYRFLVGETVERIVADARKADGWDTLDRKRQREMIQRAAARVTRRYRTPRRARASASDRARRPPRSRPARRSSASSWRSCATAPHICPGRSASGCSLIPASCARGGSKCAPRWMRSVRLIPRKWLRPRKLRGVVDNLSTTPLTTNRLHLKRAPKTSPLGRGSKSA